MDLYTCCGGTVAPSRALALEARGALGAAGLGGALDDDDGTAELDPAALSHGVVFKRVPRAHAELPEAYFGELVRAAGFAPTVFPSRLPPRTRSD